MKKYGILIGKILLFISIYIIMQFFVGIFMVVYTVIVSMRNGSFSTNTNQNDIASIIMNRLINSTNLILLIAVIITLAFYLIIFKIMKKNLFKEAGYKTLGIDKILCGLLIGLGFSMVIGVILNAIPVDKLFPSYQNIVNSFASKENIVFIIIVVSFVVPTFEETLFRGIIFNELKKVMPLFPSIIIQGLIFGFMHFNLLQGIYAFFLGIILALIYSWTKSLWANIFAHGIFNASNFFLDRFSFIPIQIYCILGIIFALFPLIYLWKKKNEDYKLSIL